jgi:phosphoribosylaminoimidazole (AIR) synthetase
MANDHQEDSYIREFHVPKHEASALADQYSARTLDNRPEAELVKTPGGVFKTFSTSNGRNVMVFSEVGDPSLTDPAQYTASLVRNMAGHALLLGMDFVGFTNIVDYQKFDAGLTDIIMSTMEKESNAARAVMLNGEQAQLGSIVTNAFNISGTAMGFTDKKPGKYTTFSGLRYAVFDPEGQNVFACSDGPGTKMLVHQRTGRLENSIDDTTAMVGDDALRKAAIIKYIALLIESGDKLPASVYKRIEARAKMHERRGDFKYLLQQDVVGNRLSGYSKNPVNEDATAVGVISADVLKNMPRSMPGDVMLAIMNAHNHNPRANGVSKLRNGLEEIFGENWHKVYAEGMKVGDFAGAPSEVYYPVFRDMLLQRQISGFYHMSGGSHNSKLAEPLAKLGLFVSMCGVFDPHPIMQKLFAHYHAKTGMTEREACEVWPYFADCYVTTSKPAETMAALRNNWGLTVRPVGILESAEKAGVTGISLISPVTGEKIEYDGRKAA